MDVLALFGWRTCRETPFKNSFSSASLPTRRSRAAMRASYSASTSAAAVSLSSPPASNLATQILVRLRPIPWRLARACSDSPPRNSWTTWRLNSIECVRCLAMGSLLESPVQLADSHLPHLSTPMGALQSVRDSEEVFLVDRVQQRDHRPLDDLVLQGHNRERALPTVRLGYVDPPRRQCPIRSPLDPVVQVLELALEVCLVGRPRQSVHTRRGVLLEFVERLFEQVGTDVVEERGEPLLLPFLRDFPYAVQRL